MIAVNLVCYMENLISMGTYLTQAFFFSQPHFSSQMSYVALGLVAAIYDLPERDIYF